MPTRQSPAGAVAERGPRGVTPFPVPARARGGRLRGLAALLTLLVFCGSLLALSIAPALGDRLPSPSAILLLLLRG